MTSSSGTPIVRMQEGHSARGSCDDVRGRFRSQRHCHVELTTRIRNGCSGLMLPWFGSSATPRISATRNAAAPSASTSYLFNMVRTASQNSGARPFPSQTMFSLTNEFGTPGVLARDWIPEVDARLPARSACVDDALKPASGPSPLRTLQSEPPNDDASPSSTFLYVRHGVHRS